MLKTVNCLVSDHDPLLVGLAAFLCVVAAFTAVDLFHHARNGLPRMRGTWLAVAGASGGFGIWATHFVAMMAYDTGMPSGYDGALTALSVVPAVALSWLGLRVALLPGSAQAPWAGGAILGCGIATMHHVGIAAYETTGQLLWDAPLAAGSAALAVALSALALALAASARTRHARALSAAALVAAVCVLHFGSMGALEVSFDPRIVLPASALSRTWLGILAGGVGILVLATAGLAVALDTRERLRRGQAELALSLANAAVEGILLCDGATVLAANDSFAALSGTAASELAGRDVRDVLPGLPEADGRPVEVDLPTRAGGAIPVEVIRKSFSAGGEPRLAVAVRDLRDRREAEERIRHMALHDPLTGLPNRASFAACLDAAIAAARSGDGQVALLLLDLDRFKEVNDSYGHAAGDDLLVAVSRAVSAATAGSGTLARLGGDEFALVMPGIDGRAEAGRVAAAAIEAVRSAAAAVPGCGMVGTSVGIALCPADAGDRPGLLANADLALYAAKDAGRGVHRFYADSMGMAARARREVERDLRLALEREELHLVYQPQRNTRTGAVTGYEALLRWRHPVHGDVPPSTFIPVAEESGLIHEIGAWVLRRACREMGAMPGARVAINVSPLQVHSARFALTVAEVLRETGMAPSRLELEVPESALVADPERALATLRRLKEMGLSITMDDFGTGYTSLSGPDALPLDRIKIDRTFVRSVERDERGAAVVRAVLGLGRGLGLPVVAEGVETEGELSFLDAELCEEVQGYLLGHPASALAHVGGLAAGPKAGESRRSAA